MGNDCDIGFVGKVFALGLNSGASRLNGDADRMLGVKSGIAVVLLDSGTVIDGVNVTERVLCTSGSSPLCFKKSFSLTTSTVFHEEDSSS